MPSKKIFWKKKKKKKKKIFFFGLVIMAAPMPAAILEFRPKFGNSGLHISAPRAPTAKKLIYSESVDQSHSNASQLVHFGQVLGKLNFSPVPASPAANMWRKKKILHIRNLWTRPVNIRWRLLKLTTRGPQGRHGSENGASNLLLSAPW